jgi:amino acid permease
MRPTRPIRISGTKPPPKNVKILSKAMSQSPMNFSGILFPTDTSNEEGHGLLGTDSLNTADSLLIATDSLENIIDTSNRAIQSEAISIPETPRVVISSDTHDEQDVMFRKSSTLSSKSILKQGSIDAWIPQAVSDVCAGCVEETCTVHHHIGKSEFIHSLFNMVNLLLGIGFLALPYAMSLTGWLIGMSLLLFLCLATIYTARIITQCLDIEVHGACLITYADISHIAFGPTARIVINSMVMLDLFAATIAPFILMSDSLYSLLPEQNLVKLKLILFLLVAPTLWTKSLKWNSYASFLGIVAIFVLIGIIFLLSFWNESGPGSIVHPEPTHLFPPSLVKVPSSFGILMASLCGHICLPSIYKDMKQPKQFPKLIIVAYGIIIVLYTWMSAYGYLMYGDGTLPEITQNLAMTPGYPKALTNIPLFLFVLNPFTKIALTLDPINKSIEREYSTISTSHAMHILTRTLILAAVVVVAILFPRFDGIMALLGSSFAFSTAIIIPCLAYLKLHHLIPNHVPEWTEETPLLQGPVPLLATLEKTACWTLIVISSLLAITGTIWSFI